MLSVGDEALPHDVFISSKLKGLLESGELGTDAIAENFGQQFIAQLYDACVFRREGTQVCYNLFLFHYFSCMQPIVCTNLPTSLSLFKDVWLISCYGNRKLHFTFS